VLIDLGDFRTRFGHWHSPNGAFMLRWITLARSWHVLVRVGLATIAVVATSALQLLIDVEIPGEPFLLYFVAVVASAGLLGRTAGFVAVAETTIASALYFEPLYSLKLTYAIHLVATEIYVVIAALGAEGICRLVESALEADSARSQHELTQERLVSIVTYSNDAIISKTLDGIVTSWNDAAERVFGYRASEMIGQSIRRLIPADRQREEDIILSCLGRGKRIEHYDTVRIAKDGRTIDVSITISPIRDAEGRIIGASKIARDETERKRTEARLAESEARLALTRSLSESEARFRATFENAAVGIAHVAPDGRWLRVNQALCQILGYSADELLTRSFQDITHPGDLAAEVTQAELMREGKIDSYDVDKRYLRKDGAIVWGRKTVGCVRKSDGSIDYFVSVIEDISARKRAEEVLYKSEERFRSSLLHSPLPILLFDDQKQILAVSRSWLEQTGYSREELRYVKDWTTRALVDRSDEMLEHVRRLISEKPEPQLGEMMVRTKDGRDRLWSFVSSALGAQSDERRLFVCMAQDVTERKAHEDQVHLLMREINHRAKNMLSLVQAIARQTAARDHEDFIERFSERIQALAANQDMLIKAEWRGIDIEDLARGQLAHLGDLVGSRIALGGPRLRLNAAAAQAIGLALHELATNASKYGALSVDVGRVEVCWRLDGDVFAMSWTECNGPPVSPPEGRGFGSTVIRLMVKRTVNGDVQLDYAPSGLTWRLICQAANALEQGDVSHKDSASCTQPALAPARNLVLRP
jgi:PAS domain S-box-containing protein